MKQVKRTIFRNLANTLSAIRILAGLYLCHCIGLLLNGRHTSGRTIEIIALFLVVCLSDIADGKLARRLKITSSFGAVLDVVADSIFVYTIHILLACHGIVPPWFIILMAEKMLNYVISSRIISRRDSAGFGFVRDTLGKLIAASYFLTPCLLLAGHMLGGAVQEVARLVLIVIAILGIISSIDRIIKTLAPRSCRELALRGIVHESNLDCRR